MATFSRKLPGYNLTDGDQILDNNGIIWEWNAEKNEWLNKGKIETIPDVTLEEDGLVTPEIQQKLDLIRELVDNGYKFGKFRLETEADSPYYYLFHSSDDLIRFIPEGPSRLRIEVDQSRLYQKLIRNVCIGPKGQKGATGNPGRDGLAAAKEFFKNPSVDITNSTLSLTTEVASPIDTPISLRFFNGDDELVIEFRIPLNPTEEVEIVAIDDIEVNETGTSIEYVDNILTATIQFAGNIDDLDEWRYKARQVGPTGLAGNDGNSFLEIVNELLPDPSVYSTHAIVSARKSGPSNVSYLDKELFDSIVVSKLSATAGALPPANLIEAKLVSAEVTTKPNKAIGYFDISKRFEEVDTPEIELPSWTPPSGCGQKSRWSAFRFNWWDHAEIDYIFRIVPTRRPPERCCEQDFFWCPNVGDQPCGVQGALGRSPNIEMPKKYDGECICECENPIEFELQSGGFVFDPIDTTSSIFSKNSMIMVAQDAVIDGSMDRFYCDITLDQDVKIEIKLDPNPQVCGGDAAMRRGCAFRDGRKVHMTAVVQDMTGGVLFNSPQVVESEDFPGTVGFKIDTNKFKGSDGVEENITAKARLIINVNDTFIDLCKGYRLSVRVMNGRSLQA